MTPVLGVSPSSVIGVTTGLGVVTTGPGVVVGSGSGSGSDTGSVVVGMLVIAVGSFPQLPCNILIINV